MLVYTDIHTDDDICTDSYKMKLIDDLYYEFEGKLKTFDESGADANIGANKSADEVTGDDYAAGTKTDVDLVITNRLQRLTMDKKGYQGYLKTYTKEVLQPHLMKSKEMTKEEVEKYLKPMTMFLVKTVFPNFGDYDILSGESLDTRGGYALLNYRDTDAGEIPYLIVFKDTVKLVKQ